MTAYTDTELQEIAVWLRDGLSKPAESVRPVARPSTQTRARLSKPARPARSTPGRLVVDGEIYRIELPAPRPLVARRQPHVAAMRFIDCLFGRCRAPLDLTLEENPENDAPGSRPGADMLCCGLRTRALKSYCAYHQARFCRPVAEAV